MTGSNHDYCPKDQNKASTVFYGRHSLGFPGKSDVSNVLILKRNGALDRIRTCDPCLRRAVLYPTELRVRKRGMIPSDCPFVHALSSNSVAAVGGGGCGVLSLAWFAILPDAALAVYLADCPGTAPRAHTNSRDEDG